METKKNNLPKPNLFLVGAPKCATSSMYTYLKQHPDVFMSEVKEPNFFARDLFNKTLESERTQQEYLSLFTQAKSEKYIGEASTWHLYSQEAPTKIKQFSPSAKIIIMLRNPIDMIYSLHSQLVYGGIENITDFRQALEAEKDRKLGLKLPDRNLDGITNKRLLYREIGKYHEQVQRYLNIFGQDNVHIILYDDLKHNNAEVYQKVLNFLNLDYFTSVNFEVINANKVRRFQTKGIQRFRNHPLNLWLVRTFLPTNLRRFLFRQLGILWGKLNTKYEKRILMDPSLRQSLQKEFAKEINQLSQLLQRDLSHWLKDSQSDDKCKNSNDKELNYSAW